MMQSRLLLFPFFAILTVADTIQAFTTTPASVSPSSLSAAAGASLEVAAATATVAWTEADLLEEKVRMSKGNGEVEPIPRLVHIRAELLDRNSNFSNAEEVEKLLAAGNAENSIATKIVHFQRHGQGYHNLLGDVLRDAGIRPDIFSSDPAVNPWIRPEIVDSPLTELGKRQCEGQRASASLLNPEAVVVSPLLRAVQTAKLSFADYDRDCGSNNSNGNNAVPWIAHEGCREELGYLVCNKRRPLSEIKSDFPELQYPPEMAEEDNLWNPSAFESETAKGNRIYSFLVDFLAERPEQNLAVVCHSAWLAAMCNDVIDCGGDENLTSWFGVSEIRSVRLTFSTRAKPSAD